MTPQKPAAIVIGAGFGGLAAAIRLQAKGYQVTLLEALDQPGGRARVWRQDGFTFDAGPTIITAPFLIDELFALAGKRTQDYVRLVPCDPFYQIVFPDGAKFDYTGDAQAMAAQVAAFSPRDVAGYLAFVEKTRAIFQRAFVELADKPFGSWMDMVKIAPDLIRLRSFESVWRLVSRHVRHPRLRQVLSFHPLLVGGNPFDSSSIYAMIHYLEREWGVHFAMGGTGALIHALATLLQEMGGTLRLNAPVKRILVERGRAAGVELASGEKIVADTVVSNADVTTTYQKLIPQEFLRRKWTDRRLERMRYSMGLFLIYFGTNRTYPDLAHHTIVLGERYQELLRDIFHNKILASDFSLYLHAPTRTDPSLAPPGCECFYVLSPVPNLAGDVEWEREKERYADAILASLEKLCPHLRQHIVTKKIFTPQDFERELGAHLGSAFSFEPILTQSAWFRPHNASEELPGLYFVGAGTHPGAGVPGVLCSAKVVEKLAPAP